METLRDKLLRKEIDNISKNFELISQELVLLQEFIAAEFGKKYERFCAARSSSTENDSCQKETRRSSGGGGPPSFSRSSRNTTKLERNLKRRGDPGGSHGAETSSSMKRKLTTKSNVLLSEEEADRDLQTTIVFDVLGYNDNDDDFVDNSVSSDEEVDSEDNDELIESLERTVVVKEERISSDDEAFDREDPDSDDDDSKDPSYMPSTTCYEDLDEGDPDDPLANKELEVTLTNQGKPMVMLDGYLYEFQGEKGTTKSWRCRRRKNRENCPARMHTTNDLKNLRLIKRNSKSHSHPPDTEAIHTKTTVQKIKTAALNNPSIPSVEVVNSVLNSLEPHIRASLPKASTLQRTVRSFRKLHGVWRNSRAKNDSGEVRKPELIEPLETPIPVEISESIQGQPRITLDGYIYHQQNENKSDTILWRCEWHRGRGKEKKDPCYVRVRTTSDLTNNPCIIASSRGEHNHPPRSLSSDIFKRKCKSTYDFIHEQAVGNPSWSATQIINAALARLTEEEKALLPKEVTLRRHISNSRKLAGIPNKALGGKNTNKKKSCLNSSFSEFS